MYFLILILIWLFWLAKFKKKKNYKIKLLNPSFFLKKGDGSMKLLEIGDSAPFCSEVAPFQSDLPQMSITVVPKRACDLMNTEIIRVLKLTANAIVPVSYSVPRKV